MNFYFVPQLVTLGIQLKSYQTFFSWWFHGSNFDDFSTKPYNLTKQMQDKSRKNNINNSIGT